MLFSTGACISIGWLFVALICGLIVGGYVVWVVITHKLNPFK